MAENFLKYTELTYDKINEQVYDKLNTDSRFDNPRESAIFQTIIEVFTGCTDLVNYYIQRRAEECYFDTAQLKSSIILLARQLGYVVTRPNPAKAKLKIILGGDFTGVFDTTPGADNKIQIPYYTKFSHDGDDFVLVDTYTYNVTSATVQDMIVDAGDFELELVKDSFDNDIIITQGDIRERVIVGNTNTQVGSNFQIYKVEDKEFSNVYGDKDFFFNDVTQVYVGNVKDENTKYQIDRRSLINWESLNSNDLSTASKVCFIRTTPDEAIEVIFGDGGFAAKGPLTREDNVYVQYLATKGKDGNRIGVVDNKVNFSGKVFTNTGVEITDKVKFKLYSNITGGSDIEDNDSIKFSAPKIYYSLDRLVSKSDYINFLKTLKTPIVVRNAIAWGEQEERDLAGVFADIKMFNVALFSVVGSLYNLDGDIYSVKTPNNLLDTAVLDLDYDPYSMQIQGYFNVYTRQALAYQLKKYEILYYYYKIIGDPIRTAAIYFVEEYGDNGVLNFKYKTDTDEYASNILAEGQVIIDFSTLTNPTMADVTDKINTEVEAFLDKRANVFDNQNYNQPAFTNGSGDVVNWITSGSNYEFEFETDSPCYIYEFYGSLAEDLAVVNKLIESIAVIEDGEISGKIIEVIDELNTRAQLNVKNIYTSPLIHNFNLEGTVYVKPLYDKEALRTELNNKMYLWLDLNADFNSPIYISKIINQFETHPGIVNADLKLVPEDITEGVNNTENKYYKAWDDPTLDLYGDELKFIFFSFLINYLLGTGTYPTVDEVRNFFISDTWRVELEKKYYDILNYINERTFLNDFLKKLFDELILLAEIQVPPDDLGDINNPTYLDSNNNTITNYRRFLGYLSPNANFKSFNKFFPVTQNSDFIRVVTRIHKDLSYTIKSNLLDSYGNVHAEYDNEDNFVRGGYSLGSEIIKVNLTPLNYVYKK